VGKELPSTLAMDYPRLVDVADFLLRDVLSFAAQGAPKSEPKPAAAAPIRTDEPIAIVAVACRFPGAPDPKVSGSAGRVSMRSARSERPLRRR